MRRYKWKANLHEERDYQLLFFVHKFIAQINIPASSPTRPHFHSRINCPQKTARTSAPPSPKDEKIYFPTNSKLVKR